ncbi:MAG: UbiA family prenyltransferase [Sphingobacteriales bacterium]|nr:UbiA family prenyltransferase [Sphingobacteriales bacterium]
MKNYLSLVKFSHTIFAMPFAMIGFVLGCYHIPGITEPYWWVYKLGLVLLCMVTARNAAMAFNRYIDRRYDEKNPRTAVREIPSGIITPKNALFFVVVNCGLFIAATFFINPLCFYLSPVALTVILGYSLTKRFTFLCHLILGVGLGLAPIGAFLAVAGRFEILPLFFSFAVLCWVAGFDIIYALQDVQFDQEHKLYSIPSYFGQEKAKWISRFLHLCSTLCIFSAGVYGNFHMLFWIGFAIFCGLLIYQHSLVIRFGLQKIGMAFFTTNGIASVLFAVFVIADVVF